MCRDRLLPQLARHAEKFTRCPPELSLSMTSRNLRRLTLAALRGAGYDAIAIMDSMSGIDALEHAKHIELLITRVRFPSGTPNGAALARMARLKRPGIKVLFAAFPEVQVYTEGLGEFLPRPLSIDELLETVGRMLDEYEDQRGDRPGPPAATERALKPPNG